MKMENLEKITSGICRCGRSHMLPDIEIEAGAGVIRKIPDILKKYQVHKVFVLSDIHTYEAAGKRVTGLLEQQKIPYVSYVLTQENPEPDEQSVGSVMLHYDYDCDMILAVGSGVINDIGKILSAVSRNPYMIVGTAPSMDGYASATSSMNRDGLKVSLPSRCADVVIGDTDILCQAPLKMLKAGLGDMLAKYVSICEWRISHEINGEYYCEEIASIVRGALKRCVDNAQGLLQREPQAAEAVFEGLVVCGMAMALAGVSRPASGVEHYFSHVWDMRGLEFGTPVELHGIQCAVGTLLAVRGYERLCREEPDEERAFAYVKSFQEERWNEKLRAFVGKGAESMIALEKKEQKYNLEKHEQRFRIISEKWDVIRQIIQEELPAYEELERLMDSVDMPKYMSEIGLDEESLQMSFEATKDIRDKYVLSRLAWDLGIIERYYSKEGF